MNFKNKFIYEGNHSLIKSAAFLRKNMNSQTKVKIIKKNTVNVCKMSFIKEEVKTRQAARKMAAAVSVWVNEFQHRRHQETQMAINLYNSEFCKPSPKYSIR